jgi:transcriptional regulator with XRE-family HTH domain
MTDRPFGEELTALLERKSMSGRELARRTEAMSPGGGTVSHITLGYIYPSVTLMEAIAEALEVEPDHFAEYRLERVRRQLDYRAPRSELPGSREIYLKRALAEARALGLDL